MNRDVLQVCLEEDKLIVCNGCDGESVYVRVYYRLANPQNFMERCWKYCSTCKDKMGEVLDWEEGR